MFDGCSAVRHFLDFDNMSLIRVVRPRIDNSRQLANIPRLCDMPDGMDEAAECKSDCQLICVAGLIAIDFWSALDLLLEWFNYLLSIIDRSICG